ncbi:MAG: ketoacyl-ACP synthase III, partial [Deltaproteobacteria bacterium]|nr:ketoacyl-ACP synthase III [Deltaproteobacteria bacterium]
MQAIISAVGHYTPENKLTNKDLEEMVDTNDEWITTRTGIKERRILGKGKGTSFMAVKAAEMLLSQRNISADELDLIIIATVTPDMPVPSTAALVQKELNASNCWGFDLNGGCTGFVYALSVATQFVENGIHQKIMVIGADKMSAIIDYEDRNTCVLFGDGAGAVLIEPSNSNVGIKDFILHMDGSGCHSLYVPAGGSLQPASEETISQRKHFVSQDGKSVFKRAVKDMADVSLQIVEKNDLTGEDIRFLIPHQANFRIIDAVAKKMGLNKDHVVINIGNYGNTTAATIPLAMSEAYQDRKIKKGDWIVISAFGAGYTWGSCLIKWAM